MKKIKTKNHYRMHNQLKHMATWGSRKIVLLVVLFFSIVLLGFSLYHFASRNYQLELAFEKSTQSPAGGSSHNEWAYSGTGAAIFLIVSVFFLLLHEIRVRRKLVEQLKMQKEQYRITINSMGEGLITTGKQGEIVYMNPAAERLTGWSNEEAKNLPLERVYDVVNEESGEPFEHIVNRILRKKQLVEFENNTLLQTKHKSKLIISNSGSPLFDARGNIAGTVLVFNDITEKKKIETELRESEKQYRTLIQNLPEAIYTCDAEGYVKLYNKAAVALWGREPVAGKDTWCGSWKIFKTDGTVLLPGNCPMATTIQEARPVYGTEIIIQRPDGSHRHVLPYPTPLFDGAGKLTGAINMLIDVTEKKEKEILVKQSEEKYRALIEQASDAILISNRDGKILEVNYTASKMLGYTNDELAAMNLNELYSAEELQKRPFVYNDLMLGEQMRIERNITHRLGSFIPVEITGSMLSDGRFMAILRDMTERKRAEADTLKAIERYDILAKATSDTIWDWDIINNKMLYNSGITKMFGYTIAEIEDVISWWKENIHPDDLNIVTDSYYKPVENIRETIQQEYRFRCADGTYKYIYDRAFVIYGPDQKPIRIIGSMQDITYKKEEEKRIAKAIIDAQEQERSYIGEELHDNVNQLLASSMLTLEMVNHFQTNPAKVTEFTGRAKEYTLSALNEIRKLSHELSPATFDDNTLKDVFETLLSGINLKNQYTIRFHFDERINSLIFQDIQINLYRILQEQVKNILKYACANTIEIEVVRTANTVRMRTFDNGIGFDTKTVKGGIGLNNMKRRVESFAGKFILTSQPGKGCEIIVEIPCENFDES